MSFHEFMQGFTLGLAISGVIIFVSLAIINIFYREDGE
jgi:hypothetical protein